jgi:hypothetical protein
VIRICQESIWDAMNDRVTFPWKSRLVDTLEKCKESEPRVWLIYPHFTKCGSLEGKS